MTNGLQASPVGPTLSLSSTMSTNSNEKHLTCLDSPTPSVGIVVARLIELEPKKDCWWRIAHDWYTQVVTKFPRCGKLHHHLGPLSYKAEGKELCRVYHFVTLVGKLPYDVNKSLTCFIIEGNNFLQFLLPKNLNIVLIC